MLFASLFYLFLGLIFIIICYDRVYATDPIQRNYPLIGRLPHYFPWLRQLLQTHFLDKEHEENNKPFNQRDIDYVKTAARGQSPLNSFGIEHLERPPFRFLTARFPYPSLPHLSYPPTPLVIGERAAQPYIAKQRIMVAALSFGALSSVAVESISAGAKRFGTLYNVGEGGIPSATREGGADLILQIGTAKYYIGQDAWITNIEHLHDIAKDPQIKMLEIKLSQGASIGKEGGFLPSAFMVNEYCDARRRAPGFETVAPNAHPEVYSDQSLVNYIALLKKSTGKPVGIKLALSHKDQWDPFFEHLSNQAKNGILEGIPDFISLDGAEGGTSAGKVAFLHHIGMPLQPALINLNASLIKYNLRQHVRIIASGKLATPERVAMAFALGADLVAIARGVMFSLGCIQAMRCAQRTCPTGIATHNPYFTKGIVPADKQLRVEAYFNQLHKDVVAVAHACGVQCYDELDAQHIEVNEDRRVYIKSVPDKKMAN